MATPTIGCEVATADGAKLGEVKELRGNYFKVDAPRRRDYWLSIGDITADDGKTIQLLFPRNLLGLHKLNAPPV